MESTCFLSQPLLEGVEVGLPVLFVDLHLLEEVLLRFPAEVEVLFTCFVQNLLHAFPLLGQLPHQEGLLGLQAGCDGPGTIRGRTDAKDKTGWCQCINGD